MESPKRQSCKEDECRPQVIVPMATVRRVLLVIFRLVYVYFHRSEIFGDFGIVEVIHFIDHADG